MRGLEGEGFLTPTINSYSAGTQIGLDQLNKRPAAGVHRDKT